MTKVCCNCRVDKPIEDFPKRKQSKDGIHYLCYECKRERERNYYIEDRENQIAESMKWQRDNKERHSRHTKKYAENHRDAVREKNHRYYVRNKNQIIRRSNNRVKEKIKTDIGLRIKTRMSTRIRRAVALSSGSKAAKTTSLLGCSIEQFREYLESKFENGMTWKNYGYHGWHIDHIMPCASFDLSDVEQQKKCFHYTNLQPLWAKDNLRKNKSLNFKGEQK